jgi:hypothetical protein
VIKATNKKKIINDPVHGFISIPTDLIFDLIENPYFQRLRRIRQLGLTYLVYPGAMHTRFQHAVGAMYLMDSAIAVLRSKGFEITSQEEQGALAAILLHDIGHGPFSHVLEHTLAEGVSHEALSMLMMKKLNLQFDGALNTAIDIFSGQIPKPYLHQLVSGQLDMDRLDYLKRDSFFTGVSEGVVSSDRIIKMLSVFDNRLVVELKGIYSIEKFLMARRLMYWQVYLHKTVLVAENMLVKLLNRARELALRGVPLFAPPSLSFFLNEQLQPSDYVSREEVLNHFAMLDDDDVISAVKAWTGCSDRVLAQLSGDLLNRRLFRIEISQMPFSDERVQQIRQVVLEKFSLDKPEEADYFVFTGTISNNAYNVYDEKINILYNDQQVRDISEASDMLNLSVIGKTVTKYYLCYPKSVTNY